MPLSSRLTRRTAALALMLAALAGCASNPTTSPTTPPVAASEGASPSFTVSGAVGKRASFDLAALQALPTVTLTVGANTYTGVSLWTLLNDSAVGLQPDTHVRNPVLSMYALVSGSDGYRAVVSLGEIAPEFGNRTALLALRMNGAPLGRNGVARLVVEGDLKPGRSVARVAAIEVIAAQPGAR